MNAEAAPGGPGNEIDRIRDLIGRGASDHERWQTQASVERRWEARMRTAAVMLQPQVRPGASVLDLGCGAMRFRTHLKPGVTYIPADLVKRSDDTHLIELNRGLWPDLRSDAAVALGVLEYLHDLQAFFAGLHRVAPMAVFTYHVGTGRSEAHSLTRLKMGWMSDFSLPQIVAALEATGWRLVRLHAEPTKRHFTQYYFKIVDSTSP